MTAASFCLGFACGIATVVGSAALGITAVAAYLYFTDGR